MTPRHQPAFDFDGADPAPAPGEALIIDIDGFEGPLHVLLALARTQKVDLLKLSVTRLADQFLAFVRDARARRFAVAADYLVMAAWLTYLKSRLLLPKPEQPADEALPAEAIAAQLAFRLAKLDAMRRAAEALKGRPILRRDVFARGDPQAVSVISRRRVEGDLRALMEAYVQPRVRTAGPARAYRPAPAVAYPLEEARDRLRALLPTLNDWTPLAKAAPDPRGAGGEGPSRASCVASTLWASLEMVRAGRLEARQFKAFDDIYLRAAPAADPAALQ